MKIKLGFFIEEHIAKLVAAVADSYEEFDSSFFVYKKLFWVISIIFEKIISYHKIFFFCAQ